MEKNDTFVFDLSSYDKCRETLFLVQEQLKELEKKDCSSYNSPNPKYCLAADLLKARMRVGIAESAVACWELFWLDLEKLQKSFR